MKDGVSPVTLTELHAFAVQEAFRADLMADAMKADRLMRHAGDRNRHRARMYFATVALVDALLQRDRDRVRGYVEDGIAP